MQCCSLPIGWHFMTLIMGAQLVAFYCCMSTRSIALFGKWSVLHCLKQLFEEVLGNQNKANLDMLVQGWTKLPKQHHMKSFMLEFPWLLLKDGVITISNISTGTKMGILFATVVATHTIEGYNLFQEKKKNQRYIETWIIFLRCFLVTGIG